MKNWENEVKGVLRNKLAAQLYTLRNEVKKDFPTVLRDLKKMGWSAVQIDGLHGYPAAEIAAVLKETGLQTAGMHVGLERMKKELNVVLEEARLFEARDLICHSLPRELQNPEGYVSVRRDLHHVASQVSGLGFRVGYHNHDFEFKTWIDGKLALDYLLAPEGDQTIYAEIDTYWVRKADQDPLSYIQKYPFRMPILHLKDMTDDEGQYFAEIGTGVIDFAPILAWGESHGVQWYAVEQDYCQGSPMDSLAHSLANLLKLEDTIG